jgi:hypothetical protein
MHCDALHGTAFRSLVFGRPGKRVGLPLDYCPKTALLRQMRMCLFTALPNYVTHRQGFFFLISIRMDSVA